MYTSYWRLQARPFDNQPDPRFYYPSQTHQASLLKLHYAVENRRGGVLLAGASGLGKTLLIRSLLDDLPETYEPRIHLRFPQLTPAQLLSYLAEELTGEPSREPAVDANLRRIEQFLHRNADNGKQAIVVIDEAHLLAGTDTLETIRLLLNFDTAWTMLLVGQPALLPALERMPELDERLSMKCLLYRFTADETVAYLSHRLKTAGATDVHAIFEPAALEAIHELSDGVPRRINRLGDLALLIGFAEELRKLTAEHIQAVAAELITPLRQAA